MQKIRFAIVGASQTENTRDLQREIEKRGFSCHLLQLRDLELGFSRAGAKLECGGVDLLQIDIFIFRGYNRNLLEARVLAAELLCAGKTVVDEVLGGCFLASKVFEASRLTAAGLLVPDTFQAISFPVWEKHLSAVRYPVVAKPLYGQKGQGVCKLDRASEAVAFFQENPHGYLLQEYLPADGDLRLLVVGQKVLGGIKRYHTAADFRSNISLGGRAERIEVTADLQQLALRATQALGYEVAGVDILEYGQRFYVLEVNSTPQWQGFKQATGINPAIAIINYCLEKYAKK